MIRLTRPDAGCGVDLHASTILQDPTMPVERRSAFLDVFEYTIRFCSMENSEGETRTGLAYTPRLTKEMAALIVLKSIGQQIKQYQII
jgi:hypothetical protein